MISEKETLVVFHINFLQEHEKIYIISKLILTETSASVRLLLDTSLQIMPLLVVFLNCTKKSSEDYYIIEQPEEMCYKNYILAEYLTTGLLF